MTVKAVVGDGEEGDGWVAGDNELWASFLASLTSNRLRNQLSVGQVIAFEDLPKFLHLLDLEVISTSNIDGENIGTALRHLAAEALKSGGWLFVQ